jgi:predicted phosphate transport protein (TIGR00153 family)
MLKRFMPRETGFFDFFERHGRLSIEACRELNAIAANPIELAGRTERIKQIEHEADGIARECIDALHRTFITPIDRADIHRLITRLDDIIDSIDSAATRMMLYEMSEMRSEMKQFTAVLLKATAEIEGAVSCLRNLHKEEETIQKCCMNVYAFENEGDQILQSALVRLFQEEADPILVIKWKDIFERLEKATDRCEDVANIIQGVVIEAS